MWAEANPNYPISPTHDYLVKPSREATQLTSRENDFKRYHLNIWVVQAERWLSMPLWRACNGGDDHWKRLETGNELVAPSVTAASTSPPRGT